LQRGNIFYNKANEQFYLIDCDSFREGLLFYAIDSVLSRDFSFEDVKVFIKILREILNDKDGRIIKETVELSEDFFKKTFDKDKFQEDIFKEAFSSTNPEKTSSLVNAYLEMIQDTNAGLGIEPSIITFIKKEYPHLNSFEQKLKQFLEDTKPSPGKWEKLKIGLLKQKKDSK
jgi:hypothetical protein